MTWVILTGRQSDLDQVATPHKIITNRDYLAHPSLFRGQRPKVINLSNNYGYQSRGYYASLLASSRGHKVIPTVETMIDLSERKLYEHALPELELALNKCRKDLGGAFPAKVCIFFGIGPSKVWDRFAKLLFDWFRAPALEVHIKDSAEWASIRKIGFHPLARMTEDEEKSFIQCLETYTNREWRDTKGRTPARYTFATLVDPHEELPPSDRRTLQKFMRIGEQMGVEVELIEKKDYAELAEYDALFIRETTALDHHTYRFAKRAEKEGMAVIDDPTSILRCTNKVYLAELLKANKIPTPKTVVLDKSGIEAVEQEIPYPVILKIPDGSFSRGIIKAENLEELTRLATEWLEDSDLLIAQKFIPTEYDWRVGVLGGQPLFAVHYLMAKKHWQIVNHKANGKPDQGGIKTLHAEGDAGPCRRDRGQGGALHRRRPLWRRPQGDQGRRLRHRGQRQPQSRPRLGGFRREGRGVGSADAVVPGAARPAGALIQARGKHAVHRDRGFHRLRPKN